MDILSSKMQEPIVPLSPALTNPDLILPYRSRSRSSTPPARAPLTMSPFFANQPWESIGQTDSVGLSSTYREPVAADTGILVKTFRPSLPGGWHTEEDLHSASDTWMNQTPPPKSPSTTSQEATSRSDSTSHQNARYDAQEPQDKAMPHEVERTLESRHDSLTSHAEPQDLNRNDKRSLGADEEDEKDPFSHAAEILANAKRRLIDMEDNLSRARRSLSVTLSTSKSSISSRRRGSPPDRFRQDSDSWTTKTTRNRQSMSHTRVFSETSVPSPASTLPGQSHENPRSSSAMDSAGPRSGFIDKNDLETPGPFENGMNTVNRSVSLGGRHGGGLEPLREDESVLSLESPQLEQRSKETSYFEYTDPAKPLTRARSSLQMRDLHERMQELRGQLTSLKIRTERDNLHRKSLQTLKTPSPFTVAQGWTNTESYNKHSPQSTQEEAEDAVATISKTSGKVPSSPTGSMNKSAGRGDSPKRLMNSGFTESDTGDTVIDPSPQPLSHEPEPTAPVMSEHPPRTSTISDDFPGSDDGEFDNGDVDDFEASDDGEPSEPVMEESHEDRPDAFDYEHFFLHSGMGTFSRVNPDRPDSQSSYGSAETAKAFAPFTEEPADSADIYRSSNPAQQQNGHPRRPGSHSRQNSTDSVSTVNTFATAIEDRESSMGTAERDGNSQPPVASNPMKSPHSNGRSSKTTSHKMHNGTYLSVANHAVHTPGRHPLLRSKGSSVFSGGQPSVLPALLASAVSRDGDRVVEVELSEDDTWLVQSVLQSLQAACGNLSRTSSEMDREEQRIWKQRLKAAQQILEGGADMDGSTF